MRDIVWGEKRQRQQSVQCSHCVQSQFQSLVPDANILETAE